MCTYLSMQIFSTWGTSTWRSRMIVCSGSLHFQERTWGEKINPDYTYSAKYIQQIL